MHSLTTMERLERDLEKKYAGFEKRLNDQLLALQNEITRIREQRDVLIGACKILREHAIAPIQATHETVPHAIAMFEKVLKSMNTDGTNREVAFEPES